MSSTDSDSSCTTASMKKRMKSSKKSKRKSQKKHKKEKRNKHKKRSRQAIDINSCSAEDPNSSQQLLTGREVRKNSDCFGPALPAHLLNTKMHDQATVLIGPQMPSDFNANTPGSSVTPLRSESKDSVGYEEEEDSTSIYGPIPQTFDGVVKPTSVAQIKLEERALQMKLAAIDGSINKSVDQTIREEWMLELPEVGLKGGLAALSNIKRKFHQGKERPDFTDRSEWTKTPQSEGSVNEVIPATSKTAAKTLISDAQTIYERKRDEEQERIARKHKKKHKRDESLVELHQKKLRREQKQKEKEMAAAGIKKERRPFSRDVDLKLNIIDKNQTKSIVDKAKVLNTKFSTGQVKYL